MRFSDVFSVTAFITIVFLQGILLYAFDRNGKENGNNDLLRKCIWDRQLDIEWTNDNVGPFPRSALNNHKQRRSGFVFTTKA